MDIHADAPLPLEIDRSTRIPKNHSPAVSIYVT